MALCTITKIKRTRDRHRHSISYIAALSVYNINQHQHQHLHEGLFHHIRRKEEPAVSKETQTKETQRTTDNRQVRTCREHHTQLLSSTSRIDSDQHREREREREHSTSCHSILYITVQARIDPFLPKASLAQKLRYDTVPSPCLSIRLLLSSPERDLWTTITRVIGRT